MNRNILLSMLMAMGVISPATAQWAYQPTPNDTLQSVRNLGNGKVVLSIYAPNAKEVGIKGDLVNWDNSTNTFKKADNGVWSATLTGIKDGVYRYHFVVDGVEVQDPKGPFFNKTFALAHVSDNKQFFDRRDDIAHGAITEQYYYSETLKETRRMMVWTPAGYEKSQEKLPVLYLVHGGGDDETAWAGVGCAGNILDNLMADGKMQPMIVVMPNGSIKTDKLMDEVPLFEKDLVTSIIPYVENNYRVIADKEHRAMAGLSMGGMETMETILNDYDKFSYFWVLSSGWFPAEKDEFESYRQRLNQVAEGVRSGVRQLVFTQGGPEDIAYKNGLVTQKLFDKANIKYEFYESPGGHSWYVWRHNLYDLAQRLFKPSKNETAYNCPVLSVTGGKVRGVASTSTDVTVFRGIPYAAPPVGELRWKHPQPVKPWKGVKNADTFGSISWQNGQEPGSFYYKEFYQNEHTTMNEDCLYLNVWAPTSSLSQPKEKLPVAVWIHGGAYQNGYGNEITMDGDAWADRGVILVTFNYRLGLLGFLSHPALGAENADGISGNYGTYDQIAALQWVHDNIAQFGGDPSNVTVIGQSAGAASVKNMVSSPLSKGLLRHAIIQSGGGLGDFIDPKNNNAEAETKGKELMEKNGYTTIDQLRAARPEDLLKINAWGFACPHQDGVALKETFSEAVTSNHVADVDYMIGYCLDDIMPMNEEITRFCYTRDSLSQKPVYYYLFTRKLPGSKDGAFHSSELWYMFHTLNRSWRPFTKADYVLSDEMMTYWTNFVKYGNPNGASEGTWARFTNANPYVQTLNIR